MTNKKGMLIVLSGPSGSGKDTILNELTRREIDVNVSVSMTTRAKRDCEIDGVHYYFVTREYFERTIAENKALEYAEYGQNLYGTPKAPVDEMLAAGKTVVLKIEVQGAERIRSLYPEAVSIFLMPPSMSVLEERLRRRETNDEEDIQRRLSIAADEIRRATEYDYVVINSIVDYAVSDISAIIRAERQKTFRNKNIISEVLNNA